MENCNQHITPLISVQISAEKAKGLVSTLH